MEPGGEVVSEANVALFEASLVNGEEDGDGVRSLQTNKEDAPLQETVPQMLARHQKDKKELQNKELALKKAAAKGSKAEQKAKKKQVEEDVAKLQAKMEARHLKELALVGYTGGGDDKHTDGLEALAKAMAGVSTGSVATQSSKVSKGQKWKEKRAQQEAKRELKIQEEQTNVVSDRSVENQLLERKLRPLRLTLKEIKPDGHCLYRAVEHQLSLLHPSSPQHSFQQLREIAAAYMRENSKDFIPFVASECEDSEEPKERFESYCKEVESTAAWGGELELRALAHALGKHIVVLSGDLPDVEMGKEYEASGSASQALRLSYHRHAFGLGEHYNSVMPLP